MTPANDLLPPRYRRPTRIGYGGMGEIFRAEDEVLGRTVAVKVLAERYARDDSLRSRFTREALAAARLSGQPNTVTIFDVGEWHDRPFIVMEHLDGSLEDRLRVEDLRPRTRRSPGSTRLLRHSTPPTATASSIGTSSPGTSSWIRAAVSGSPTSGSRARRASTR